MWGAERLPCCKWNFFVDSERVKNKQYECTTCPLSIVALTIRLTSKGRPYRTPIISMYVAQTSQNPLHIRLYPYRTIQFTVLSHSLWLPGPWSPAIGIRSRIFSWLGASINIDPSGYPFGYITLNYSKTCLSNLDSSILNTCPSHLSLLTLRWPTMLNTGYSVWSLIWSGSQLPVVMMARHLPFHPLSLRITASLSFHASKEWVRTDTTLET